jgi:hypothetical protein
MRVRCREVGELEAVAFRKVQCGLFVGRYEEAVEEAHRGVDPYPVDASFSEIGTEQVLRGRLCLVRTV